MKRRWTIRQLEEKSILDLLQYPSLILKLLALHGYMDEERIEEFLNPEYSKLLDPFLFLEMQKAVERIAQALEKKEKILIYADYDADAITACAVVFLTLQKLGANVDVYIPDRFSEGYGINAEAVKKIAAEGAGLLITVDCGTNAVAEAEFARSLNLDLIITDHHEITGQLPQAVALINPKNPKDNYPFPFLTGVGVAFKLVCALVQIKDLRLKIKEGFEKWLLDLVAIGTVADCQSLTGENRILVSFGLKVLQKTRNIGLKALIVAAGITNNKFDTFTLGFLLAPRINAAGRIKHADIAFKLLVTQDQQEAEQLALQLNELNSRRQQLTELLLSEAREKIIQISDKKILLAAISGSGKERLGVVGLVAGKLAEEYNRPVLILEQQELIATGSGRSSGNFDLVAALKYSESLLQRYGGHTQAAGLSLLPKNLDALHLKLLEYAEFVNFEPEDQVLEIDAEVSAQDLTWENYGFLEKFEPFGAGNARPRFLAKNFRLLDFRLVGNGNKHLKMQLSLADKTFDAIAFGRGFLAEGLSRAKSVDAVFELDANEWNGNRELQLKIVDLKVNDL